MVYVAIFIYKGVLDELEVFVDRREADLQADEWRKEATPDEDVVDVLEREIIIDLATRQRLVANNLRKGLDNA